MPFQAPITIAKSLERIQRHEFLLPAFQREFVWQTDQICRLFDSLMQDYPIGSFLFWKVEPAQADDNVFYDFIKDYHQLKASHLPKASLDPKLGVTSILDGQQRLTALNIGLRGSYAERISGKWARNPDAYPVKYLHLELCNRAPENELGMEHNFQFLTMAEATARNTPPQNEYWFPVARVMRLAEGPEIFRFIQSINLATHERAFYSLSKLHSVIHKDFVINYFEEESRDLDKVLNIFIRVNSGGTVLSYSDLLLSIAAAKWQDLDAKDAVYGLVDDLNDTGLGFGFSKDLVLKSGLVTVWPRRSG